jgi:hypothetical protein
VTSPFVAVEFTGSGEAEAGRPFASTDNDIPKGVS